VKIRGLRSEWEEIEAVLRTCPGVAAAAVTVAGEAARMTERLVAHVVAAPATSLDLNSLRQTLRNQLPGYMVPVVLPPIAALPLTSSGKVNRRALKSLADAGAEVSGRAPGRVPRTPTELTLARFWCELLSRESVDCETSFFTLGGHSLLAVRLFHQIERDLGARLPLESLFHNPTIEGLAGLIDGAGTSPVAVQGTPELIVPLRAGGTRSPLFLLPSATGNILFWQRLLPHLPEGLPVLGVVPQRDAQGNPVWESLAQAVAPMCDAVNRSQPTGPLQLLGYSAGAYMAQELARQLEERGREVGFLGLIDTGPGQFETDWADRLGEVPGYVRNLGYWIVDNNHRTSWRNLWRRWDRLRKRLRFRPASQPVLGHYRTLEKKFLETVAQHPTRPVRVPITLFRARCQSPWHYRSNSLGWTQLGCHAEIVRFAGVDHFDIVSESHFPQVAAEIVPRLAPECSPGPHGT
ncbi:MAG: thioesterase domain-containing protein, partial [Planctomycetaceae bacterium]